MGTTAVAFGHFRRPVHRLRRGWHAAIAAYARARGPAALFAVALLDASVIGAFAVSLSSAYAIGDVPRHEALAATAASGRPRGSTPCTPR